MIYAVVSLIREETWQKILELIGNPSEINSQPKGSEYIHISWLVAQNINIPEFEKTLKNIAKKQTPLLISSGGLGIFGGEKPKITLNLARNASVDKLHSIIWRKSQLLMSEIKQYYSPELWMPHITLVQNGFGKDDYQKIINKLIYTTFQIQVSITNLAILYQDETTAGMLAHFDLKNGEK
jgi:2'-5' RNA ligase